MPPSDSLPIKAQNYVTWEDVLKRPELADKIRWGRLKSLQRAFEKLSRAYHGDASRLVDLCRQHIVFDSVGDLTQCLGKIITDDNVWLVLIKNRMDLHYDSSRSAGYRDVTVLLQFNTPEAIAMACETHICEVQLVLRRISDLKRDDGHARYIKFSNARAE
mmetsp:Transcript_41922/g.102808  ORF Transcript_41922/g.102808 Transcript_41922/m.102808 type:complete len:161 (+) Transcript_41922:3-485(+)